MERGERYIMHRITPVGVTEQNEYLFGGTEGASFGIYILSQQQFETVGTEVLTVVGNRKPEFAMLCNLFYVPTSEYTPFDAFMLLEEISSILLELENRHAYIPMMNIYRSIKHYVYYNYNINTNIA